VRQITDYIGCKFQEDRLETLNLPPHSLALASLAAILAAYSKGSSFGRATPWSPWVTGK
jgi:hypothetical protein